MKRLILSSVFLFAAASILAVDAGTQVIVIANASVKASGVSKDDLKDVFYRQRDHAQRGKQGSARPAQRRAGE